MSTWLDSVRDAIAPAAHDEARAAQAGGQHPADALLKAGHLTASQVLTSLSRYHNLPAVLLGAFHPREDAIALVPEDAARRLTVMPLFVTRGRLYAAFADPGDLDGQDWLSQRTGLPVEVVVSTPASVEQAINRCYGGEQQAARKIEQIAAAVQATREPGARAPLPPPPSPGRGVQPAAEADDDAPLIRLVNHLLATAVRLGASDIHLEPFEDAVMLRYRVDGVLREYPAPPLAMFKAVTSRIKIISELDVSERRLPQDGRTTYTLDGRPYDLRVSIMPNLYGESIVIRILDSGTERRGLADLGFNPTMLAQYRRVISRPYGMVLVTGPTGSGKSTTLYATLRDILTPEKKIITLEDPVEAQIRGVTQFQMNNAIGYTFARALRSVLRHDPEIVLVGEIRDKETAEIAIRASLTGHMLFSTLHTNDAPSAVTRLIDMGVSAYMVMTSLLGVLAQRLVRRLCVACRVPLEVTRGHLDAVGLDALPPDAAPFRPMGCAQCEQLGLKGRVSLYEWMEITPAMRRLSPEQTTADRFRELARENGFVSMRESAIEKWVQGLTSLEEVMKVTVDAE